MRPRGECPGGAQPREAVPWWAYIPAECTTRRVPYRPRELPAVRLRPPAPAPLQIPRYRRQSPRRHIRPCPCPSLLSRRVTANPGRSPFPPHESARTQPAVAHLVNGRAVVSADEAEK